ncbi:hypothetical protein A9K75_08675 [Campylobacter fetus subsp. testudinum]|uniref:hypothetical protein n=1 Tax=Campylobacter fetus TaxID=196 RepID=UPI000818889E|nr:hypothetical protein [Campylobacter fetus]OCR99036.1 hypothetical protein A9K75_08675 [Campylobacter fetus subsp. testudinum]
MLVENVKKSLIYKISSEARKLPPEDELSELFMEAMLFICNRCVPNKLVRQKGNGKVYRNIEDGFFITYPDKPLFNETKSHLMIDETLTYAVINEVAFLLTSNPLYRQLSNEIIDDFIANDGKEIAQWRL